MHTDPLFHQLNILKVHDINVLQTAIFMFKYTKDALPQVLRNFSYPTRTRNNIHLNNPKLLLAHKSLRHHGPDVWNALPDHVKHLPFIKSFKRKMKENIINHDYNSTE